MKKKEIILASFVALTLGTLMHFACAWLGCPHFAGYIFPVDECVWEHMKMVFYPMLLLGIYFSLRTKNPGWMAPMILMGLIAIPVQIGCFFIYWPFTHHSVLVLDCILYYGVLIAAIYFGNKLIKCEKLTGLWPVFCAAAVITVIALGYLTYNKPGIDWLFHMTDSSAG